VTIKELVPTSDLHRYITFYVEAVYKKQMDQTSITDVPAIKKAILDPKTQVQNPTKNTRPIPIQTKDTLKQ
jgi:hypothetical protein